MTNNYRGNEHRRRSPARKLLVTAVILLALAASFLYAVPMLVVPHYLVSEADGVHLKLWFVDTVVSTRTPRPPLPTALPAAVPAMAEPTATPFPGMLPPKQEAGLFPTVLPTPLVY